MRKYTFEIVITEGNDEFWEGLKGTGCDAIMTSLKATLDNEGWYDAEVTLKKFEDN